MGLKNRYLGFSPITCWTNFLFLPPGQLQNEPMGLDPHYFMFHRTHNFLKTVNSKEKLIKVTSFLAYSFCFIIKSEPEISVILITCSISFS